MPPAPSSSGAARRPVTRLSQHFGQMLEQCPNDIHVYGACVANITGGVDRSACEAEFNKLKECFARVAKNAAKRR